MRLKSLELVGFKSFLEPTIITFAPGVTAVVGPNGCGKSNVVDAIRWVLGEQAPSRLRGKSTEDLIYAGNDSNPAAGMAEVTFLMEAEEGSVLPEPYSTLSEVAVTRRVYRSGDSEYLINKIPCRLKDITEFFMATQIHSRGYALIEQGRIEEIIQAKPIELRAMVEEAAGLSLFKGRREISERKLERVSENLARVDDILKEIERQLAYARRQAKKAEAYRLIRSELVELERLAAARRLLDQHSELAAQSTRELELKEASQTYRNNLASLQTDTDNAGAALQAIRDELSAAARELENLRTATAERSRTRSFLEKRLGSLDELRPSVTQRVGELELKVTASRASRAAAGARLARELNRNDDASETHLAALREEHQRADRALRESERRTEEVKDALSEIIREAAVVRGRLADLAGERAELEGNLVSADSKLPELRAALTHAQEESATLEAALGELRNEVSRSDAFQRESANREIEARTAMGHQASRLPELRAALADARQRAQRIMPNGAGELLRTVLESLNGDRPQVNPSMLLEVMKAPPALEPALRAVLGDRLDAVIVDSPHFALRAIEILKENQSGRLNFIPESLAPAVGHEPLEAPGISGRLLDLVEIEPRFAGLAEALLGHVMVAEDLRAAHAASNLNGYGTVFVTREGDLLWPDRVISGGSGEAKGADGYFSARQAAENVAAAEAALAEAEAEQRMLAQRFEEQRAAHRKASEELAASRAHAADAERALTASREEHARARQRLALAEAARANADRRVAEIAGSVVSSNVRLEELARLEQETRSRLGQATVDLDGRKAEARRLSEAMLEVASQVESRKATLANLKQEHQHLRRLTAELESQIDQHRKELERAAAERSAFLVELENLVAQDESAAVRIRELEAAVEELRARCADRESAVETAHTALKDARTRLTALDNELIECGLKRERARTLIEELEHSFIEKFQTEFSSVATELETALSGRDFARDDERLVELRAKAERIGEVNLAAESEVRELEERAAALNAERADLQAAVDDLSRTIQKLNREARKRFAETFEGAARHFSELFPKLLRGGKGRLELTDANDVLEAGVNILVQPVGKKVKEIGLLSGGEKALSAMALIFSLFLLNPSPFCVMDEVDAPLDEFSLAAFTSLVRELKERSQFIIITHNQRTMQAADHIHGVTMERPGVSRIISLKIPQAA